MRIVKEINITNIIVDSHSISPQSFDLAKKIESGEYDTLTMTPIKLENLNNGTFRLRDGRHRITAFKLVGRKKILSKYFDKSLAT